MHMCLVIRDCKIRSNHVLTLGVWILGAVFGCLTGISAHSYVGKGLILLPRCEFEFWCKAFILASHRTVRINANFVNLATW